MPYVNPFQVKNLPDHLRSEDVIRLSGIIPRNTLNLLCERVERVYWQPAHVPGVKSPGYKVPIESTQPGNFTAEQVAFEITREITRDIASIGRLRLNQIEWRSYTDHGHVASGAVPMHYRYVSIMVPLDHDVELCVSYPGSSCIRMRINLGDCAAVRRSGLAPDLDTDPRAHFSCEMRVGSKVLVFSSRAA